MPNHPQAGTLGFEPSLSDLESEATSKQSCLSILTKSTLFYNMRVAVITPKTLCPKIPNYPVELIENHLSVGSLLSSGFTVHAIYWDNCYHQTGSGAESYIINYCRDEKPDLVVFGAQPSHYALGIFDCINTLKQIKVPTVHLWWDHISPDNQEIARQIGQHITLNVVMDQLDFSDSYSDHNFINLWYPIDGRLYHNQLPRDIDVSFMGTITDEHKNRIKCLSHLERSHLEVFMKTGAYAQNPLTIDEYASILLRSKIGLNFSYLDRYAKHQCKSRTFETLRSGALLLESDNPYTAIRFKPYVEYVPFSNERDLEDKVRYYLSHDDERQQIANNGRSRAETDYSEQRFWQVVLTHLESTT